MWNFGNGADGQLPYAGLTMDSIGNLFGTTSFGGSHAASSNFSGTAFELSPPPSGSTSWIESILWSFGGGVDGATPVAKLLRDQSGNLYGTTVSGGTQLNSYGTGQGTVFKLAPPPSGQNLWSESILWDFGAAGDGALPYADLITDESGNLFGTTETGGANASSGGTVFEIANAIASGGQIYIKPRLIRFPPTALGSTSTVAIGIRNTGSGQLTGSVTAPSAPFGISGSGDFSLAPRSETTIALTFTPTTTTPMRQFGAITSNSMRNSTVQIGLEGKGR